MPADANGDADDRNTCESALAVLHTLEYFDDAHPHHHANAELATMIMTLITPNLFHGGASERSKLELTHQESMNNVLMFLATTTNQPELYLREASRAIKTFVQASKASCDDDDQF